MRGCLHRLLRHNRREKIHYIRHDTGHADQRVDAAEGDRDTPETRRANNAFRECFVPGGEREHGPITVRVTFVNVSPRVTR
jgi:hypothetical protein